MKATNKELINTYSETKSVWKTAKCFNMCGQSVHERLIRLKVEVNGTGNKWTLEGEAQLISLYRKGFERGDGKLDELVLKLGKTKAGLCKKAKILKLTTTYQRPLTQEMKIKRSLSLKKYIKENGHPKGYLGHKHNKETLRKLSKASKKAHSQRSTIKESERIMKILKTKEKNGTLYLPRDKVSWKAGWRQIGGKRKYYRSGWEANYARYLQWLKENKQIKEWEHEPKTFWFEKIKRGCRSYLPDFKVIENNGEIVLHEVKGWMDNRSKTKIKRMKKYYPNIKLIIIGKKTYKEIKNKISGMIKDWE